MDRAEAIGALKGLCMLSGTYAKEALDIAISALQEQECKENPKPLTLDELRQMDGEPVWAKFKTMSPLWGLCVRGWIRTGSGFHFRADVYEAEYYRVKPKEAQS